MGTGFDVNINPEEEGIVPRAVTQLFDGIDMRRKEAKQMNVSPPEFTVCVQFMEVKCKLYFFFFSSDLVLHLTLNSEKLN